MAWGGRNWKGAVAAIKKAQKPEDYGGYDPDYLGLISDSRDKLMRLPPKCTSKREESSKVDVFVRKRPLNAKESKSKQFDVVTCIPGKDGWGGHCFVHECKKKVDLDKFVQNHEFEFDMAFGPQCDNTQLYVSAVRPLLAEMASKKSRAATVFAYGQTGSGKTSVVLPGASLTDTHWLREVSGVLSDQLWGAAISVDIFEVASALDATVSVRFFEVYGGKAYDLLSGGSHCAVQESAKGEVVVVGLTECPADTPEMVSGLIDVGLASRKTGCTSANAESSRSHSLFEVSLQQNGKSVSKMTLVDLAGSERGADRGECDSRTRQEGAEINKSLLALKECVRALYSGSTQHVPFRGSRLTHIMRDAFVGAGSHTIVVACVSPAGNSAEHTLNTLRYASRIKEKNNAGGCGGDRALNGGVGPSRPALGRLRANSVGDVLQQCAPPAAPMRPLLAAPSPEQQPRRSVTPPTPLRPAPVDNLLNLRYQKKKASKAPKKPLWDNGAIDENAVVLPGDERGSWLYNQEDETAAPNQTVRFAPAAAVGVTMGAAAILQQVKVTELRCDAEKAVVGIQSKCYSQMEDNHKEDRKLLEWARQAQEAGELDAVQYMARLDAVLKSRAEADRKLQAELLNLRLQVEAEDRAAAEVESLLVE